MRPNLQLHNSVSLIFVIGMFGRYSYHNLLDYIQNFTNITSCRISYTGRFKLLHLYRTFPVLRNIAFFGNPSKSNRR
jgi:hypothetical protein